MAKRQKRYDTEPLVMTLKSHIHSSGGLKNLDIASMTEQTYYNRNRNPDKYQLGELRSLMIAYGIPKEDILAAVDKALSG